MGDFSLHGGIWLVKHFSNIWNMAPTCLLSIWWECKTHTFEDNETFKWSHIRGFAQCISIYDFLHSVIFFF